MGRRSCSASLQVLKHLLVLIMVKHAGMVWTGYANSYTSLLAGRWLTGIGSALQVRSVIGASPPRQACKLSAAGHQPGRTQAHACAALNPLALNPTP